MQCASETESGVPPSFVNSGIHIELFPIYPFLRLFPPPIVTTLGDCFADRLARLSGTMALANVQVRECQFANACAITQ